ncbi:dihydroorotase [Flavobacterium sp. NST-5]|uniref:Dihydroorotase n=1 Tax=Flavobacterium ichthyis TaxID=2698827 RepID=A0ABW9Z796_9FLAO|nr:dihydroorotase [Flavobacterium ichthyis]NBL63980.1 dihydroorotase [Flavobacterium ichthyis]
MTILIKNATIIDPESAFHRQKKDLLIENGKFKEINTTISNSDKYQIVEFDNLYISSGWFDMSVSFGEPGFEERETIANGLLTAAKSGFTAVALQPNCFPIADNQAAIAFAKNKSTGSATQIFPIGALTKNSEGKDLAELFDMKNAGAIAFGDYNKNLNNANLMKIALQYTQDFNGLVLAFCEDENVKGNGVANEGISATKLGLKGIPALAEELQIARNLFILEYCGGKIHFPTISTKKSVELIREAKTKNLNVTCSVSTHHLTLNDKALQEFDTRLKVSPPLRDEETRKFLLEAVLDGTIDAITSDHNPIDIEHKKMEFDLAKNGTIGLESAFGALLGVLPLELVIEKLTFARNIFGIEKPKIAVGEKAEITLFDPDIKWTFTKDSIQSKSKNSAFLGTNLTGKPLGIYNNNTLILNK